MYRQYCLIYFEFRLENAMNKIKLIVIAIFMSASTAVIAAEGFQLVSETEYREQTLKIRETERSEVMIFSPQ